MKVLSGFPTVVLLAFGLLSARTPASAQIPGIALAVTSPTNTIQINGSLTYRLNLTNTSGALFQNMFVTNALPGSAQFLNATNNRGAFFTNGTSIVFSIPSFIGSDVAQMTLTVKPTAAGFVTNTITVSMPLSLTNVIVTKIVTQVTNVPSAQVDLAVSITNAPQNVIVNDLIAYSLLVTNQGSNTVSNVILSNTFSANVTHLDVSPSNQSFTTISNGLIVNLGTLTDRASRSLGLTLQPASAGTLVVTASVTATNDSNTSNNTASLSISVGDFLPGGLVASNVSGMIFNPQTGLMEQKVRLFNTGTNAAPSARVLVSGLTNVLYNAVGTNNGNPFVVYGANLNPGQSVDLVLEYFVPTRLPIAVDNTNYIARAVPAVSLAVDSSVSSSLTITNITVLPSGNVLIEFTSIPGRSYTIFYGESGSFTNAAQPAVVAPADKTQWIDDGPPKTVSHPTNTSSRFYRVLLNP